MAIISIDGLKKLKPELKKHPVKEWGGHVNLIKFTAKARDDFALWHKEASEKDSYLEPVLKTISLGTVDDDGNSIFPIDQLDVLEAQDSEVIDSLYKAITAYNGIGKKAEEPNEQVKP